MHYHPWRALRSRAHLDVSWRRLPAHTHASIDGTGRIAVADDLTQVERRVTITHELVHDERGIPHGHDPAEEIAVEREVARRLIPIEALIRVARLDLSMHDAAEELWVTPDVLACRLSSITHPAERAAWAAAVEEMREHHAC